MKINSLSVPKRSVYGAEHYLSCTSCLKPSINFVALTPSQSFFFLRIAIVPKTSKPNGIFLLFYSFLLQKPFTSKCYAPQSFSGLSSGHCSENRLFCWQHAPSTSRLLSGAPRSKSQQISPQRCRKLATHHCLQGQCLSRVLVNPSLEKPCKLKDIAPLRLSHFFKTLKGKEN